MTEAVLVYLLLGAFAGTAAGLLGVGGGLIIVPVLALVFSDYGFAPELIMHLAVGTSLATIVLTSISSVRAHHQRGAVMWPEFARLTPGIVLGAWLGAAVAHLMPTTAMRIFFGCFELAVAAQLAFGLKPNAHRQLPGNVAMFGAGGVIGTVSAIVGIGGGTLTVPFLVWCNVAMRNAVATSSACGLPIAVAGAIGFVVAGWNQAALPDWSTGYVYWPAFAGIVAASVVFAPLGAWLAHQLPAQTLKRVFALFLAVLGIRMLMAL
ncbi:MAG: sulfite exporter TauE/SafE family protein [Pseudomonadota bacterium]|nr:MAG: sulfite exporter TauE/SafE family protein [Pseudomonadota bacterium]